MHLFWRGRCTTARQMLFASNLLQSELGSIQNLLRITQLPVVHLIVMRDVVLGNRCSTLENLKANQARVLGLFNLRKCVDIVATSIALDLCREMLNKH